MPPPPILIEVIFFFFLLPPNVKVTLLAFPVHTRPDMEPIFAEIVLVPDVCVNSIRVRLSPVEVTVIVFL